MYYTLNTYKMWLQIIKLAIVTYFLWVFVWGWLKHGSKHVTVVLALLHRISSLHF